MTEGNVAESPFAQMCGCPKRILGLLNGMLVPGDRQSYWQHWGGGAPLSITLLCSFRFFSALLFLEAIFCFAVPYSALFYSALLFRAALSITGKPSADVQEAAAHRISWLLPLARGLPLFSIPMPPCQKNLPPLYGSFSHRSYISLFGNIAQLCTTYLVSQCLHVRRTRTFPWIYFA